MSTGPACEDCGRHAEWKYLGQDIMDGLKDKWRHFCDMHRRRVNKDCQTAGHRLPNWHRIQPLGVR